MKLSLPDSDEVVGGILVLTVVALFGFGIHAALKSYSPTKKLVDHQSYVRSLEHRLLENGLELPTMPERMEENQ